MNVATANAGSSGVEWKPTIASLGMVPGDTFSFACRVESRTGTNTANTKILIRQYQSNGTTEITASRQTYTLPASFTGAQIAKFSGVLIDAACVYLDILYLLPGGATDSYVVSEMLLAKGAVTDFRPYLTDVFTTAAAGAALANRLDEGAGMANLFLQPNLINNNWAATVLTGAGNAVRASTTLGNGKIAVQVTYNASEWYQEFTKGMFPSGYLSASAVLSARSKAGNGRVLVQQLDSSSASISASALNLAPASGATLPALVRGSIALDPACVKVRLFVSANTGSGTTGDTATWYNVMLADGQDTAFRPYLVTSGAYANAQVISPTGDDNNVGSISSPKKTLNAAKNALANKSGRIFVRGGTYATDSLGIADTASITVEACYREKPVFMHGETLTGWTKTPGYTNIYQATMGNAKIGVGGVGSQTQKIFEHGTPYGLIADADRHPLQKGRQYRCPDHYPYNLVASLAVLDTSPASFWNDPAGGAQGGTTIYVNFRGSSDPTGKTIVVPWGGPLVTGGVLGVTGNVEVRGITEYYPINGCIFTNATTYVYEDSLHIGGGRGGLKPGAALGRIRHCEFSATGGDGYGDLVPAVDYTTYRQSFTYSEDVYSHDNFDDGYSGHDMCTAVVDGGLYENNGGSGVTPALGMQLTCNNNTITRYNGDAAGIARGKGGGFHALGGSATTPPVYTVMNINGGVSYGNSRNIQANNTGTVVNAYRTTLGANAAVAGETSAKVLANTGTTINLFDVTQYGTGTVKSTNGTGVINVTNSTLVT